MPKGRPSPEALLAKADERLEAARVLHGQELFEDAVGRSYYAMFCAARALLSSRSLFPRTHKGVLTLFGLEFVKKGFLEEMEARALAGAREQREEAEYEVEGTVSEEESQDALDEAERFVSRVRDALQRLTEGG